MRGPFQGVGNIVRFNWHFYVAAVVGVGVGLAIAAWLGGGWWWLGLAVAAWVLLTTLISLVVSWYIYDYSKLYTLDWLDLNDVPQDLLNIHAGFDETSELLTARFPNARLRVLDFYDPALHTEVSIKRARAAYPPYAGTERVQTGALPLVQGTVDVICVLLSAHEIRDDAERVAFFRQLKASLRPGGRIIVTEHLRDTANFLAYTLGFLHFLSRQSWWQTFQQAGLVITHERKITPFIPTFTLLPNGNTP